MAYYRIRVGNRQSVIESDSTMEEMGLSYGDRLVGECDQYGHLWKPYIDPKVLERLSEYAKTIDWSKLYESCI